MKSFQIIDTLTKEVVASRGTKVSAAAWCKTLNDGLNNRYIVSKVV